MIREEFQKEEENDPMEKPKIRKLGPYSKKDDEAGRNGVENATGTDPLPKDKKEEKNTRRLEANRPCVDKMLEEVGEKENESKECRLEGESEGTRENASLGKEKEHSEESGRKRTPPERKEGVVEEGRETPDVIKRP